MNRRADALAVPLEAPTEPAAAPVLALPRRQIDLSQRFAVMAIINRTPDSFYSRGTAFTLEQAVEHALLLIDEGADIIDVGGVKGGPGDPVGVDEEIDRVVPFIERLRHRVDDTLISVDTFRSPVAAAALDAGADIVNDVTGLHDAEVLEVVADHDAGYVAMHHSGAPRTRPFRRRLEPDAPGAVVEHCRSLADRAVAAGVDARRVIVDPGHDFQKTTAQSLEVTRRLPELNALGHPVLVALSNKDFVGETLDAGLERRVDGSLAAAVFSALRGAHVFRVHEVARTVDALRMTEALLGWRDPARAVRGLE